MTNEQGQHRLQILSRPTIDGTMFGVLATLQVGHGSQLVPVVAPIVLCKIEQPDAGALGLIAPTSPHHPAYHEKLMTATSDDFVRFYLAR